MNKIIFELNEFNNDLLIEASRTRANIRHLVAMHKTDALIPDTYESDYLEPWSQWVSIHTGVPCTTHKIKHLGDIGLCKYKEAWNIHHDKFGIIWGCLNSNPPENNNTVYFPDPWTSSSNTNLRRLRNLQKFLRTAVSDRGDNFLSKSINILYFVLTALMALPKIMINSDLSLLKILISSPKRAVINPSSIYSILEYVSFNIFLNEAKKIKRKGNHTDIFFSNMLAHCQHYYWGTEHHSNIELVFDLLNKMLEKMFNFYNDVVVLNGLTQEYSANIESWNSYYPKKGWKKFINLYISPNASVLPCMSYDTILEFKNVSELESAKKILDDAYIEIGSVKHQIFLTELYEDSNIRLFVRFKYYSDKKGKAYINSDFYEFDSVFVKLATRTARHIPLCNIYTNIDVEDIEYNWDIFKLYA